MRAALLATGTVVDLELRQRVRSTAWYVLLAVFAAILLVVTVLLLVVVASFGRATGRAAFSAIVFLVLLLGCLVTPALSGGAVNGDRDAGTLATTQVTLVTTAQLLIGKFLAAWTASLAFLAVAVPFLLVAVVAGGVPPVVILVALLVTVLELGTVAAVGTGLSAMLQRPIFSVVTTYLVVAALTVGTLLAFGLGGLAVEKKVTEVQRYYPTSADEKKHLCRTEVTTEHQPRFDLVWWILAANPFTVLADAVPGDYDRSGEPRDGFSSIDVGLREAQLTPPDRTVYDECDTGADTSDQRTPEQIRAATLPGWFVGIGIDAVLAVGALLLGLRSSRTPARRLARGSRIA